ncbi:MAG: CvpA family protein [Clostridiales bacterium]|nr:CvpA family protein [Clostridiales bacterium]
MDPIKVDFSGKGNEGKKAIVIPPERAVIKIILSVILAAITGGVAYYFMLPPMNPKAIEFYYFIAVIFASFVVFLALLSAAFRKPEYVPFVKKHSKVSAIAIIILVLVAVVGYIVGCQFFRAKSYSKIMTVKTDTEFASDIEEPDFSIIPKLDESASASLASRALSDLANMGYVSQFTVYPSYPQINYKGDPVRVASLQYANIIKWFTNKDDGLPGYIIIDMAKEKTEFVDLKQNNIRFSLADHFGRNVKRVIRFAYPSYIFDTPSFEIDENGDPYWICARIDKTIGLFGGRDVVGAVLVDALTGECEYYDIDDVYNNEKLSWIDRVYSSDLLVEQFDFYGKYRSGFFNSILGQKDCIVSTDGYNYLAKDNDVWLYTGVTSVTSDQSITGFVLVNQRTKDARFYSVSGAKEATAKTSAEGLVQQYEYIATFPLLLNIAEEPTYFMSLKDANDIVQMYAMINVKQYNKIKAVGDTISDCFNAYKKSLQGEGIKVGNEIVVPKDVDGEGGEGEDEAPKAVTVTGKIEDIRSAVIDGNSVYFIKLKSDKNYYRVSAADSEDVVVVNYNDTVTLTVEESDDTIKNVTDFALGAPKKDAEKTTVAADKTDA